MMATLGIAVITELPVASAGTRGNRARFCKPLLGLALALLGGAWSAALAHGHVRPGALAVIAGKTSHWSIPAPDAARDPVVDADGNVYVAIANGDRIVRLEPASGRFKEWNLPAGTQPHGIVATGDGRIFFGGRDTGMLGELDPRSGEVRQFSIPLVNSGPYSLALDGDGNVWFTDRGAGRLVKFDRAKSLFSDVPMDGDPYGLVIDARGIVWVTRIGADKLSSFDPKTGKVADISTGAGSKPRRLSIGPDGMLWVSLYGTGKLLKVDSIARARVQEYSLPGGPNSGPYSVNVDALGRVWVSEFQTDSVSILDPKSGAFRTVRLPARNSGVRNAAIDAQGRYWYVCTTTGKLGVIE